MTSSFKKKIIILYFIMLYLPVILAHSLEYIIKFQINFDLIFIIYTIFIIFIVYRNTFLTTSISVKLILFTLFLISLIFFDRLLIQVLFLCGSIDSGVGFLQNSGIVESDYCCCDFTIVENFLLDFFSSFYYPIYIFIFIKPFVNHLDKSIRKIKKIRGNNDNV